MTAFDLVLLTLATLRMIRLVTTDSLLQPLFDRLVVSGPSVPSHRRTARPWVDELLTCPHCIGFHIGIAMMLLLSIAGGPGDASTWWRWGSGAFALNYITGHVSQRLDGDDDG